MIQKDLLSQEIVLKFYVNKYKIWSNEMKVWQLTWWSEFKYDGDHMRKSHV
jgi:hypothetical protein